MYSIETVLKTASNETIYNYLYCKCLILKKKITSLQGKKTNSSRRFKDCHLSVSGVDFKEKGQEIAIQGIKPAIDSHITALQWIKTDHVSHTVTYNV